MKAIELVNKAFGKGMAFNMNDDRKAFVKTFSTGLPTLDIALGGGLPYGRVVEMFGPESGGKTTIALYMIKSLQAIGGKCAIVDAEHALDPAYMQFLGVDIDDLLISQPDYGEQALEIVDLLIHTKQFGLIVIDSVSALVPKAELDGEMGDQHMGLQARMMSKAMRKLIGATAKAKTTLVFINQIRDKIGVMWGSPTVTPGGKALKFASSVRLDVRRIKGVKKGSLEMGYEGRIKVVKNKVAPPFKEADFMYTYGVGIDSKADSFNLAVFYDIVNMQEGTYYFDDEKLGKTIKTATKNLAKYVNEKDLSGWIEYEKDKPHCFGNEKIYMKVKKVCRKCDYKEDCKETL